MSAILSHIQGVPFLFLFWEMYCVSKVNLSMTHYLSYDDYSERIEFRGKFTDAPILFKMSKWSKKYGPIYTFWAGHKPIIMVNSFELSNEALNLKKNDFIDRPEGIMRMPTI